jgi:hypothetical protein
MCILDNLYAGLKNATKNVYERRYKKKKLQFLTRELQNIALGITAL